MEKILDFINFYHDLFTERRDICNFYPSFSHFSSCLAYNLLPFSSISGSYKSLMLKEADRPYGYFNAAKVFNNRDVTPAHTQLDSECFRLVNRNHVSAILT